MKASKAAALCGISAALGSVMLLFARFELPVTLSLYAASSVCIMLPLSRKLFKGALLTYIATAAVAFFSGGVFILIPYALFFGLHPILSALANKYIGHSTAGKIIAVAFKLLVFVGLYYAAFALADFGALLPKELNRHILALLLAGLFIPYDCFMGFMQASVSAFTAKHLKM